MWYHFWVTDHLVYDQLPTQVLALIPKVRHAGPHESRPEHNGKVTGVHLVLSGMATDLAEVATHKVQSLLVDLRQCR